MEIEGSASVDVQARCGSVTPLGRGLHMIDLCDWFLSERTAAYVFPEEEILIETGPAVSFPFLLKGLTTLGMSPRDIRTVIVTHIHLDHAGALGLFLQEAREAQVIVHPRGARHLADPQRLIRAARELYRSRFDEFYAPVLPVDPERIRTVQDGDFLLLSEGRRLFFYDAPGHAPHHIAIYAPHTEGVFTGDAAGVWYSRLAWTGTFLVLPSTVPSQFDPEAMRRTWERLRALKPRRLFFSHFGETEAVEDVFGQLGKWLPQYLEDGEFVTRRHFRTWQEAGEEGKAAVFVQAVEQLSEMLWERILREVGAQGRGGERAQEIFRRETAYRHDVHLNAYGVIDYLFRQSMQKEHS